MTGRGSWSPEGRAGGQRDCFTPPPPGGLVGDACKHTLVIGSTIHRITRIFIS